jgi:hypothetical protein
MTTKQATIQRLLLGNHCIIFFFISPFLFAHYKRMYIYQIDVRRGRERGAHQHPSVISGAKPGVEVGNRYLAVTTVRSGGNPQIS